jgi:leader peptidase (prepilin peptidase) / N-methyltransferase
METLILVTLAGLVWGSFLNVVIYRLPLGLNLSKPPSACPACGTRIKPYDNIPVLSFIILGGKCRACGKPIPFSYVLAEILTPLAFLVLHHHYGLSLHFFASAVFTSALIVLAFIDYRHKILPDHIVFPGIALGLAYAFFRTDGLRIGDALLGAAVGAGFLLLVYGAYYLVRKKEGMGLGDVTMMVMIGIFLGWLPALLTLILASLTGVAAGIAVIVVRKRDLQFLLPYGTFLAPAAFIALVWGNRLIAAYLGLFR